MIDVRSLGDIFGTLFGDILGTSLGTFLGPISEPSPLRGEGQKNPSPHSWGKGEGFMRRIPPTPEGEDRKTGPTRRRADRDRPTGRHGGAADPDGGSHFAAGRFTSKPRTATDPCRRDTDRRDRKPNPIAPSETKGPTPSPSTRPLSGPLWGVRAFGREKPSGAGIASERTPGASEHENDGSCPQASNVITLEARSSTGAGR